MITNYDTYLPVLNRQTEKLNKDFFSGDALYKAIAATDIPVQNNSEQ